MTNFNTPDRTELPTVGQLNKATGLAAVIATVLLVTTVLPAEYGIDPTGVGGVLGLTAMGDMKQEENNGEVMPSAVTTINEPSVDKSSAQLTTPTETGQVTLTLQPGEGREVKATMKAGEEFEFAWFTDGSAVNYDQHGEVFGAASNEFTSYDKGTKKQSSGTFRAPFDGTHGWFWRNRTEGSVTITVTATGQFEKFELKE